MLEKSAGGIVFFGNDVLLLRKSNGNWVLPKGKIEDDEMKEETALREVFEEAGVKGKILEYIGCVQYTYKNYYNAQQGDDIIDKIVHWYIMKGGNLECKPQVEEGFVEARYVHISKAISYLRYEDERRMMKKAIDMYTLKYY